MKITLRLSFFFLIFFATFLANAQEIKNVETLIVNEWTLKSYELNGQEFPPKEEHKADRMIFNTDKTVESISNDEVQKGVWSYDKNSGILKVVDQQNRFDMKLKVISITNSECALELENPKGTFIKMHMISK